MDMSATMGALKLSPSSIEQSSKSTTGRTLTWNEEAIMSKYAEFKGVDLEENIKLLKDIEAFKCVMDLFVMDEREKKSFFVVFIPFSSFYKKKLTGSRKKVQTPRSETLCKILSYIKPGRRYLIYSFAQYLATMECPFSLHTRIDTFARLLPFFFETVYERMFLKDPTIFKRRDGDMKPHLNSPSVHDCMTNLLSDDKDGMTVENAKVTDFFFLMMDDLIPSDRCRGGRTFLLILLDL